MKQIIELIKKAVAECKADGDMFKMPDLERPEVKVIETEHTSHGAVLYSEEYRIEFPSGEWVLVEYESRDQCRPFQINPDRSVIHVTSSDSSLGFNDAWEEKY